VLSRVLQSCCNEFFEHSLFSLLASPRGSLSYSDEHLDPDATYQPNLSQVPCIERNGLGAIKAVSAASLALRGDGSHLVSLDVCIESMRQTGLDMSSRYKETSLGGLAANMPHMPNC